ncbi:cyanophycinase [Longimicrobium sp.]|uniref:cyanophycinase n=1 Tax=Longimicrobium sp. TaxID=2029185 RepID=UPI002BE91F2E|nr:cyanophycinase [Longimicrobium sp.]HSU17844.1 cyanophycinase [Longimicrobium sp.]
MERQRSNGTGGGEDTPNRRRSDRHGGTLVLIGGACDPAGEAFGRFVELAGGRDGGRIVGLTTASAHPLKSARAWMKDFSDAGATHVEFPIVDSRDRAQDAKVAEMLRDADGIFLGGGDQVHLVTTLGGSKVGRALAEAYTAGAVICGTSAGAAALTETILAGGEPDQYGQMQDLHLGPGFGLLGFRAVIDTHFTQRRRLQRLFMVIARNAELMGLGIDEDTAMVVRGHLGEVVGRGSVTFVDGRGVRFDNADECETGTPLTLSYLRVGIVGAGYTLNLRERELENLLQTRREQGETTVLRSEEVAASTPAVVRTMGDD